MFIILLFLATHFLPVTSENNLVFAQVLFRHGARAPSAQFTNESFREHFPRGLGELTDRGFKNSYLVGKYLAHRYLDTGFLNKNMISKEMYWRSMNIARCLSTGATVGAAMFEELDKHLHVPISTQETDENLLNYDFNSCYREMEIIKAKCPSFTSPDQFKHWPDYEAFIANCLNYTHKVFDTIPFQTLEAHLNEYKNGLPVPQILADNIKEIIGIYVKTTHWITGTGTHHDPNMMMVKFGILTNTLISNIEEAWKCHNGSIKCGKSNKKLKVYSTQDFMLMGTLAAFGVQNVTIANDNPEYNSMIIMELWDNNGSPEVKFYYKAEEVTELNHKLIDVSTKVRNCQGSVDACPLEKFINCCDKYRDRGIPGEACMPKNTDTTLTNSLNKKKRKKRFAGPS